MLTNGAENHQEHQYIKLVAEIIEKGNKRIDRTGVGTLSIFGTMQRYSLANNSLPALTTKRVFLRGVIEELLWFISGSTDARLLASKGINIWNANASRGFLDSIGLVDRDEGDLGPVYGFQWRHSGAQYANSKTDYTGQGIDQLNKIIKTIRQTPADRRMLMCAWNPADLGQMALPPCHLLAQFHVADDKLSCLVYLRAGDMGLGVPFNIVTYALLTHMVAHVTGLKAHELVYTIGDTHVYLNHIEPLKEQLTRTPRQFPTVEFARQIDSIDHFKYEDFIIKNYEPHPKIPMEMAL